MSSEEDDPDRRWAALREQLAALHGPPSRDPLPLGNRANPDDELLFLLLTLMTRSQPAIERTHAALLELAGRPPWATLARTDTTTLQRLLQPVGLVQRRSSTLQSLGATIVRQHAGTLRSLTTRDDTELLRLLEALPGVGRKTARCLAAYSFGRDTFAVDVHVVRVLKRLGLVDAEASWAAIDEQTNTDVPVNLRYDLHVLLVQHGRECCTCVAPRCDACPLQTSCPSAHQASETRADYVVELRRHLQPASPASRERHGRSHSAADPA